MAQRHTREFEDYDGFVEKFKPKKTTDDCYTPPKVYDAVLGYVRERYGVPDDAAILRPFRPGGDFEREEYPDGCFVVDNPPFSIMARIIRFYCARDVKFFLFAPALTLFSAFSPANQVTYVACGATVEYANGAKVSTSFATNMGDPDVLAESAPELLRVVKKADEETRREKKKSLPKYEFPDNVCTAAMLGRYAKHGVDFKVRRGEAVKVAKLDAMGDGGIYGGAFLLGDALAAERAAAERAAAGRAAEGSVRVWRLSPRERAIVEQLVPLDE